MIERFFESVGDAIRSLDRAELQRAIDELHATYERDGQIYVFGNGGSHAMASHWVADFNKTVFQNIDTHLRRFRAVLVPSSVPELTAWANDEGYEEVFSGPLRHLLRASDTVVAISSSGSSPNIIRAVDVAHGKHIPVIGFSGFSRENSLARTADIALHVETSWGAYGIVESAHGILLHALTAYFQQYLEPTP